MNRRSFIPTLALLPVMVEQLIDIPKQYDAPYCVCGYYLYLNGTRYTALQYDSLTGTITVDKCWQIEPKEGSTFRFEAI